MQGFKTSTGEGCIAMRAYTPNEQVCFVVLFLSLLHVHIAPKPPLFLYFFLSHGSVLFSKRWRSLFFWDAQPCKKHYWRLQMKAPLREKVIAKTHLVSPTPFMYLLLNFQIFRLGTSTSRRNSLSSAPDMWLAQGGHPHFIFALASASLALRLSLLSSFSSFKIR